MAKRIIKLINPQKCVYWWAQILTCEYYLKIDEYWEKNDDSKLKLFSRPIYNRGFDHIVVLLGNDECRLNFVYYLIHHFTKCVNISEKLYQKDNDNKDYFNVKRSSEIEENKIIYTYLEDEVVD